MSQSKYTPVAQVQSAIEVGAIQDFSQNSAYFMYMYGQSCKVAAITQVISKCGLF